MDPLSGYDYPYNYEHVQQNYMYNVKMEPMQALHHQNAMPPQPYNNLPPYGTYPVEYNVNDKPIEAETPATNEESATVPPEIEEVDTKEHIKLLDSPPKRRTKKKGKTSNFWNKKIEDKNFPFYGCTICNVSFTTITDLDQHVTIHKGRITSYDIRLRNQVKRKEKIKLQKKLKKLGKLGKIGKKLKVEEPSFDIEIKPEDGYIGNETTADYKDSQNQEAATALSKGESTTESSTGVTKQTDSTADESKQTDTTIDQSKGTEGPEALKSEDKKNNDSLKKKLPYKVPEDPRLQKLFKCFACQKQFSLSYYLKLHVRSHTDEKPYTCSECGQSFITASKLGRHNKRIHLAIRYQCRICYRFFYRFDILRRHFDKAHTEEKLEGEPYDYNAILPYLKELEEQLREKEMETKSKAKTEDLDMWGLSQKIEDNKIGVSKEEIDEKNVDDIIYGDNPYVKEEESNEQLPLENIMVDEVKIQDDTDVEVKVEINYNESDDVDDKDFDPRDDSASDEDYFPSNTWAATPKMEAKIETPIPHKKVKKGQFPLKCELCDKMINTHSYYKVHLRTHSGDRPFKCYICNKGFITSSKMHRHVLTHSEYWENEEKEKVKSEVDENKSENGDVGHKETKKRKSKKPGQIPCISKKKKKKGNMPPVSKKEYKKRPHACLFCNKRFLHLETLQVHQRSHEGEELVLRCSFCLESQPGEEALRAHEATHSGPRPYLCTVCGRGYTKRETMIYHRKTHDTNEKRNDYICDVCSKIFNSQSKLQRHLVSHRVDKFVLRYECPVCAHMFNTKYHVQMHLSTHQKEGLILEENRNEILAMVLQNARKIPKKADTSINLSDLIPADERSRVCNICGQVFQHFYYLEEHLKSHGSKIAIEDDNKPEEKKHICPVCQKGFKLHYYLKLHSFTHTKLKPFICQQCGKGFITKGKLKRHLETHAGLKKFQCHICYKFFTRPSYLRIHVRTIHGTQDYNFRMDKQFVPVGLDSV